MFDAVDSPEEKRVISDALGYSSDLDTVKDVLSFSVTVSAHILSCLIKFIASFNSCIYKHIHLLYNYIFISLLMYSCLCFTNFS